MFFTWNPCVSDLQVNVSLILRDRFVGGSYRYVIIVHFTFWNENCISYDAFVANKCVLIHIPSPLMNKPPSFGVVCIISAKTILVWLPVRHLSVSNFLKNCEYLNK